MSGRHVLAIISVIVFAQEAPTRQEKTTEEVRAAYSQFVDRLNAIATSVTDDVWTPEFVDRIQGLDRAPASRTGLATISVDRVDVIDSDYSLAVVVATRTIRWSKSEESPEETSHDAVLAVLVHRSEPGWRVACQLALSSGEAITTYNSAVTPKTTEPQHALEATLDAITSHDAHAVEQGLSQRTGRCLAGEIGRFLRGATKMELRSKDLIAVAGSDDTAILTAMTRFRELSPSKDSRVAGWLTLSRSVYVLRRASDKTWKIEHEIRINLQ